VKGVVQFGFDVWTAVRPWRRLKVWRNKKRAAKGLPLLPITQEDDSMLPKGSMTYTGIAVTAAGVVLRVMGVGECSAEEMATAAQACVDPVLLDRVAASVNELFEIGGLLLATLGRRRAAKREASLTAPPQ
jgi:hypothetical protein